MKKSIIFLVAGICIGVFVTVFSFVVAGEGKKAVAVSGNITESVSKTEATNQTDNIVAKENTPLISKDVSGITVESKISSSWEGNGEYYAQYDLQVTNNSKETVKDIVIVVNKIGNTKYSSGWNCTIEEKEDKFYIGLPEYNKELKAGDTTSGIGFIMVNDSAERLSNFSVLGGSLESSNNSQKKEENTDQTESQAVNEAETQTAKQSANDKVIAVKKDAVSRLMVNGTQLCDENKNPVILRGVSTHGLAWYPEYVNYEAFKTLKEDWKANVIRLAMYTDEYGGYCNGGDKAKLKQLIEDGVNYATSLGMYVIIDWHILNDNNPQIHKADAISFFDEISQKYSDHTNVIYEICNEPHGVSWQNDIKPYANEVVKTIRKNDDKAVIIVGTNTWSQDVTDVIGNTVEGDNIMYALHFYAATHTDWLRDKLLKAKNEGVAIFVSECSICDASGNGQIDYNQAEAWLKLMNDNAISFVAWSLSNKAETSALIKADCQKKSGWQEEDLSDAGKWFKNAISK